MQKKMDQRGLSLIELLVVVTILAITVGIVTMTFQVVNAITAESCAKKIDSSIETVKTETTSKATPIYLVIYEDLEEGGYYVATTSDPASYEKDLNSSDRIADATMTIEATFTDGSTMEIGDQMLFVTFDRATGALSKSLVGKEKLQPNEVGFLKKIQITGKGRESTIWLVAETGKHYVE